MNELPSDLYFYSYMDKNGELHIYMTSSKICFLSDRRIMFKLYKEGEVVSWSRVIARYKPLKKLKILIHY